MGSITPGTVGDIAQTLDYGNSTYDERVRGHSVRVLMDKALLTVDRRSVNIVDARGRVLARDVGREWVVRLLSLRKVLREGRISKQEYHAVATILKYIVLADPAHATYPVKILAGRGRTLNDILKKYRDRTDACSAASTVTSTE